MTGPNVNSVHCYLNGVFRMPVIRVGTASHIKDERGISIPLFKEDSRMVSGRRTFHTSVFVNNEWISVAWVIDTHESYLNVFPKGIKCDPKEAHDLFLRKVNTVSEVLTRFGGWELGGPELKGQIEYGRIYTVPATKDYVQVMADAPDVQQMQREITNLKERVAELERKMASNNKDGA